LYDLPSLPLENISSCYTWDSIEKICFERKDLFYDLHIPFHEHYIADGFVNHNSGKTFLLARKAILHAYINAIPTKKGCALALYEPVDEMIEKLLVPELDEILDASGLKYTLRASAPRKYTIDFPHGRAVIYLNSFENWRRIVGGNYCFAGVDEIDTVQRKILDLSWKKLVGRVRVGHCNQIFCTTTPEGFNFAYDFFGSPEVADKSDRILINLSTLENPFTTDDYIRSLYENYPPNLIDAYVHGQFVNLATKTAYHTFDRNRNGSKETVQPNDRLYIGQDFNVGKMASAVSVKRGETYHAVDELWGLHDTSHVIYEINNRYPQHRKELFPDVSGNQRHTSASATDLDLFAQAGFQIVRGKVNPAIKDRVNCMNTAFLNGLGQSKLFVNVARCPNLTRCLEQQALGDDGKPEKKNDLDHLPESFGYMVYWVLPVTGLAGFGTSRARV
jgi:hypothetical protein